MSNSIVVLIVASWAGCLWLGFEIGHGRSEQRRKNDLDDLERRFRIVTGEAVEAPGGVAAAQSGSIDGENPHRQAPVGA